MVIVIVLLCGREDLHLRDGTVLVWSKEVSHCSCLLFADRAERKELRVRIMSFTRNRSQSSHSPNVNPRALQMHLQGAQDALSAFDGYHSSGPALQPSVLERPAGFQRLTVLQQLLQRGRRFISSIVEAFRWSRMYQYCRAWLTCLVGACELAGGINESGWT
jgi:hypothetical protein